MEEQTRFIVFTAGFNSEKWVRKNILSIENQTYENYVHVVVDDMTTDDTAKIIDECQHPKLASYRNNENRKWIYNSITYIPNHIESDEDVIIIVDMDDWLAHKNVLKRLNEIYTNEKVWLTFGSFAYCRGSEETLKTLKSRFVNYNRATIRHRTYREDEWFFWHLRTFKVFLWQNIDREHMKSWSGNWALYSYDKVIGYPMLEMCPQGKIRYVEEILYTYNKDNPLKTHGLKPSNYGDYYRNKPKYDILER